MNGVIKRTENGQPYIERPIARSISRRQTSSLYLIEMQYGPGIRLYFSFLKFIVGFNGILALCGLISWVFFLHSKTTPFSLGDFFVFNYVRPQSDTYWFWTNVIAFFSWFVLGPAYMIYEKKRSAPHPLVFLESSSSSSHPESDIIHANTNKETNYFLSICLTLTCFSLTNVLVYGLIYAQQQIALQPPAFESFHGISPSVLMSLVVTLALTLCNSFWNRVSFHVTHLEANKTWGRFKISQAAKLIGVKMGTTTIMFVLIAIMLGDENDGCLMGATNFFFNVIIDTFVMTIGFQIIVPSCFRTSKPEFNIANQLLGVVFRQFMVYIGLFVFPLMGVLGLVSSIIDYHADKFRLLHICRDPHFVTENPGYFLLAFMTLAGLCAMVTYPNGGLWMLFIPQYLPPSYQNCSIVGAINRF